MKKFICLLFILSFSINLCYSQSNNQLHDLIINSMMNRIAIIKDYQERGIMTPLKNIIFLKDNFPYDFPFSETEKELGIVFFEKSLFHKSELKKGIQVNKLGSIVLNNDMITISFIDYQLRISKNTAYLANGGATTCKYILNCQTKEWEKMECRDNGI